MKKGKTTKGKIRLPANDLKSTPIKKTLPYDRSITQEGGFSFSFKFLDRNHKLFNLGGKEKDNTVGGDWFLDLLDCLKSVGGMTIQEMKQKHHQLHPVRWESANAKCPLPNCQIEEWWQFRLNKAKGRVYGFSIDGIFYITWLDPYHNFQDSKGYGTVNAFDYPKSIYEKQEERIEALLVKMKRIEDENQIYKEQLESI